MNPKGLTISRTDTVKLMKKVGSSTSSLRQPIRSSESSMVKVCSSSLTEDILIEIFLRLPEESLFNVRYLSKFWFYLLNPSFITRWLKFNNISPPPWGLFYKLDRPVNQSVSIAFPDRQSSKFISNHDGFSFRFLNSEPCSFNEQEEQTYLLASSNGLVLCSTRKYFDCRYCVCNPLTKKWVFLPPSPQQYYSTRLILTGFINETSSSIASGITYYKVVRIPLFENPSTNFDLEIFSSITGEWKTHKISCPGEVTMLNPSSNVVSRNEVLYWIEGRNNRIIAYDLFKNNSNDISFDRYNNNGGHRCRLIDLPDQARGDVDYGCLGESEGFISYIHCQCGQLSVWELEDYFSRGTWDWCLVHSISVKHMLPENCEDLFIDLVSENKGYANMKPLAFNPVDQNVVILGYSTSFIFAYNIKTRRLKLLSRDSFYYSTSSGALPFVLVSGKQRFDHHLHGENLKKRFSTAKRL